MTSDNKWIATVNLRPSHPIKDVPQKFSIHHAKDEGSAHITCQGQKRGCLVEVPENCNLALQIPSTHKPSCTIQNKEPLEVEALSRHVNACDPSPEHLLSQRLIHVKHDHNYCQFPSASRYPDSQTVAQHSDTGFASPPVQKAIRLEPSIPCLETDPKVTLHHIQAPDEGGIQRKRKTRRDADQDFKIKLQTAIEQSLLPCWSQQTHISKSERDTLIDSFIYYCAARERARLQKLSSVVPQALSHSRFECPIISGSNPQHFCNVHREDDRESIGILNFMRQHPSYKTYLTSKTMMDMEFSNFILTLVICRIFNSENTLRNLGFISPERLNSIYQDYQSNPEKYKKHPAYQLNVTYGKAGLDMGQFIFELIPAAIRLFPGLSSRLQRPMRIETLSQELNTCLKQALPFWYQKQPNGVAVHKFKPPRATLNPSGLSKRDLGIYEFKMQDGKILRKKQGSQTSFTDTRTTAETFNYQFNFSQAFADAATLCPNLVDPKSGMIPGPGTKQALSHLRDKSRSKPDMQEELKTLYAEIKSQWPDVLGPFNIITLEHSLCEWTRWLANTLSCRKLSKPYKPRASLSAVPQ
ncbi:hypothetical protein M3P05_08675 [Sansalvadorimonas sp. 2012CJ34-2]|uniref:Uncharacterized protein n=1 Tax=Parendozoicomonas callyspongiae TaxID=2942213 RepID=A0ABT0PF66_9GAMM|nr:hypothetical protein [Sansalvadorimonas sp. 2012CJ34-2]MCL6270009.1 hypothetical protein [Sansalvadorimonas sp. 2012CJ34-2]